MLIHIGQKIKDVFYQKRLKVNDFANKINKSRNVVYNIFNRATIDSGLLYKIGEVLDHNFFQYYLDDDNILMEGNTPYQTKNNLENIIASLKEKLEKCKNELEQAQKEAAYLKKINDLLENKKT